VCGGKFVLEFTPTGQYVPGSPFTGGGADGAGFGITLDPRGNVWLGNFGFAAKKCQPQPSHTSVFEFTAGGRPLSPSAHGRFTGGFRRGDIRWPQGTVSDRQGRIWIANCNNNTVTRYAGGNPNEHARIPLQIAKPFDIAFNGPPGTRTGQPISPSSGYGFDGLVRNTGVQVDPSGNVWVANNWKSLPLPDRNPGGYQMVVFIGLAGPLRTPLIGPPRPL
jgi:hypothetical protein